MIIDEKESALRIKRIAWRTYREAKRSGAASLTVQDIEQELWIAWCKARDSFDPSRGVPFMAYLTNGLKKHAMGLLQRGVWGRIHEEWAVSLSGASDDDEGPSVGERLPSPEPTPDIALERRTALAFADKRLSERASTFLRILADPPQALLDELRIAEARSEHARHLGVRNMNFSAVTSADVFKVMGAERCERTRILAEVRSVGLELMEMA